VERQSYEDIARLPKVLEAARAARTPHLAGTSEAAPTPQLSATPQTAAERGTILDSNDASHTDDGPTLFEAEP
jgi:hypothetical protein